MEQIIQAVKSRITAQIPAFKYVDEEWGQLDYYSPNFPVKWPCALIDILSVNWENKGHLVQTGMAQLRVKVANLRITNSSTKAPQQQQDYNAAFYGLTAQLFKALHGFNGNGFSALIRLSDRRLQRDDGVKLHEIIFITEITDRSAMPVMDAAPRPTIRFQ